MMKAIRLISTDLLNVVVPVVRYFAVDQMYLVHLILINDSLMTFPAVSWDATVRFCNRFIER